MKSAGSIAALAALVFWPLAAGALDENGELHPRRLFWGDTHLHTAFSMDAFMRGTVDLTPETAYAFARGDAVSLEAGGIARLGRPLDFLVIADHAEYLGLMSALRTGIPELSGLDQSMQWRDAVTRGGAAAREFTMALLYSLGTGEPFLDSASVERSAWQRTVKAAEASNEPGEFSAFAGFEWTSSIAANNLHRVVMFRDSEAQLQQFEPFTQFDGADPEQLWEYLADYQKTTGGGALAIPHNGNLSNGLMFAETTLAGKAMDRDYAMRRQYWEPLVEVTQIKGDSETHPLLSPNDEFAAFGTWDTGNFSGQANKQPWMLQYEYARSALLLGLKLDAKLGVNPYQFGMIGSTDAHSGLASVEEDNFLGASQLELRGKAAGEALNWKHLAGGYTAVWARENTREALFDAMRRREVYATTGTRMIVRMFAGWHYDSDEQIAPYNLAGLYKRGVPMGGVLPPGPGAPMFLLSAMKDPEGANLDRIQVIKGWLDSDGVVRERVYDVAWAGDRSPGADGHLAAIGSTVDLARASYSNAIGAPELATTWRDPDFDPLLPAFYYLRVLEIPTPRWIVHEEARSLASFPPEARRTQQERAYTSPVWYRP